MKGFETFFEAAKSQFTCQLDVLVSLIHWMLVQEFDFVNIGIGEEITADHEIITGSELLPKNWNSISNLYTLLYRSAKAGENLNLLLKCTVVGDLFLATAVPLNDQAMNVVHSVSIRPNKYLTDRFNESYQAAFKQESTIDQLADLLRHDMFHKLRSNYSSEETKTKKNQTVDESKNKKTLIEEDPNSEYFPPLDPRPGHQGHSSVYDPFIFPRIGGADLDPLNRGFGSGMIFDPFHPSGNRPRIPLQPGLPRGAIPPGARFDPIGPFGRFSRPDPDHLPPPKGPGYDDMFM